ncbi:MAG: ABC transporter substrate-binding protein [Proteobacteria bacterium]|nr:nitrate ABC transporter substrate-binding protein [Pseudomonadota bacterium]NOG59968.1 ABC transporter substrate-binding protein [Pseudomonadota bacterium]
MNKPEKNNLKLGFIPLTDCCVLAIASEKGMFEKYGLNVELSKEASWANIRDKVCVGALDGAHMLAGIPIATTLGLGFTKKPMVTAFSINLNGNAITVSNGLYERLLAIDENIARDRKRTAMALKQLIEEDKYSGKAPLTFAMVYPYSSHNYELQYWMASAGIDPAHDVNLRVIPPQYMVRNLQEGQIDGYCAGGPWNSYAVKENIGKILITGYEIWNYSPEKVLGVTREWAENYPDTHFALIMSLLEAAAWIEQPKNRVAVIEILAKEKYIGISEEVIGMSMADNYQYESNGQIISIPDHNVFHRYLANYPWRSHAIWIMTQMYRWGQFDQVVNIRETVEEIYRPDIYRQAAQQLNMNSPTIDYKTEGQHQDAWSLQNVEMGADAFFDGQVFDSEKSLDYLTGFDVHNLKVDLEELKKLNQS